MKKNLLLFLLVSVVGLSLLWGYQEQAQEQEDPLKNFSIVNETQPVQTKVKEGFDSIKSGDAVAYLRYISSDLLEGRETATPGYELAAHYVASLFEKWGIKPAGDQERPRMGMRGMVPPQKPAAEVRRSYFQNIAFIERLSAENQATIDWQKGQQKKSKTFKPNEDYFSSFFRMQTSSLTWTAPVVFVGYGIQEPSIKFDEYKNIDVKGKFVMMLSEAPRKDDPESPFNQGNLKEKYNPPQPAMMRMRLPSSSPKFSLPRDLGAEGILLVDNSPDENPSIALSNLTSQRINDERPIFPGFRRWLSPVENIGGQARGDSIPTIQISQDMANYILGLVETDLETLKGKIEGTLQSQSQVLQGVTLTLENRTETKLVNSMNVLGYLEGTDPELKDEAIVIGAHLDHLGRRGDYIFNGADDNGSGSVGVLEIAEAFTTNPVKPKRSIIFALWTAEEKGLNGSRYYVAHPFMKTAVYVNLDMISRAYTQELLDNRFRRMGKEAAKQVLDKVDPEKYVRAASDAKTPELANFSVRTITMSACTSTSSLKNRLGEEATMLLSTGQTSPGQSFRPLQPRIIISPPTRLTRSVRNCWKK